MRSQDTETSGRPWFTLIPGLTGIIGGTQRLLQEARLEKEGIITSGTVVQKELQRSFSRRSAKIFGTYLTGEPAIHGVTYSFTPADRKPTEGQWAVSASMFHALRSGTTVSVRYLPGDPTVSKIDHTSRRVTGVLRIVTGAALLGLSVLEFDWHRL